MRKYLTNKTLFLKVESMGYGPINKRYRYISTPYYKDDDMIITEYEGDKFELEDFIFDEGDIKYTLFVKKIYVEAGSTGGRYLYGAFIHAKNKLFVYGKESIMSLFS